MTESQIKLQWIDNNTTETAFDIEQGTETTSFVVVKSVEANIDSAPITGIFTSAKTYSFRLFAKNSINTSAYSNADARTLGSLVFVTGSTFQMGRNGEC